MSSSALYNYAISFCNVIFHNSVSFFIFIEFLFYLVMNCIGIGQKCESLSIIILTHLLKFLMHFLWKCSCMFSFYYDAVLIFIDSMMIYI